MLLFFTVSTIISEVIKQCSIEPTGLVLTEYYQTWCPACQKMDPVLEEVDNRLERNNINLRIHKVNIEECNPQNADIKSFPTLILKDNDKEIARSTGYKNYEELTKFILEHSSLDKKIFEGHVKSEEGKVTELYDSDLYQGLDGPWFVFFYYKDYTKYDYLIREIAKLYEDKINVGRISFEESKNFVRRYDIKSYPAIYGFYNGLQVPFVESLNLNELSKFCNKLIEPSLEKISYDEFINKTTMLEPGEPIYLVLHKNQTLANEYFSRYAHKYKYKVTIFKSDDPKIFQLASIYPQSISDAGDHNSHKDAVKFGVYKNGLFYEYKGKLTDEDDLSSWIFNTHFNYVTEITNSTFSSIFSGFKPAMILVTRDQEFMTEFNNFSADRHLGTPYIELVFASIDVTEYSNFVPTLLPNISIPCLVVFDPIKKLFKHKKIVLTHKNFRDSAMEVLKLYESDKLPIYPYTTSYTKYYLLGIGIILSLILFLTRNYKGKKKR